MAIMSKKVSKSAGPPAYPLAHPEIFYRLQPDIMQVCDELESVSLNQITPEIVKQKVEKIRDNVSKRYPDLAASARDWEKSVASASSEPLELFGVRIERSGFFGDLIGFLLLAELFRRRRFRRVSRRISRRIGRMI